MLPLVLIGSIAATCLEHWSVSENLRINAEKQDELSNSLHSARKEIARFQQDFQKSQRHPKFQPFINGLAITGFTDVSFQTSLGERTVKQASVVIPAVKGHQEIMLRIRNIGNFPADRLSVFIRLPQEIPFTKGSAWQSIGLATRTPEGISDATPPSFYIDSLHLIDPGAYFSCDRLSIDMDVQKELTVPINIEVSSLYADKQRFNIFLIFKPGVGAAYLPEQKQ